MLKTHQKYLMRAVLLRNARFRKSQSTNPHDLDRSMSKPLITSVPVMSATVGVPYTYQVQAVSGSSDPMEQLKTALVALNSAIQQYEITVAQAEQAMRTQLAQVRDAINTILGDGGNP